LSTSPAPAGPLPGRPDVQVIDICANLAHSAFADDRADVIATAHAQGVVAMVVPGACLASTRQAMALAAAQPGRLFATAGIHPHAVAEAGQNDVAALGSLLHDPQVVAVGECGLDYHWPEPPTATQRALFAAQLEGAADLGVPLFLHEREAHADFMAILKPLRHRFPGGVVHCFSSGPAALSAYLDLGLYVGITGWICDERRGQELRALVRHIPASRLLVESDAPYLTPRDLPRAPRRNVPAATLHVLRVLAGHRGEQPEALAPQLLRNTMACFPKLARGITEHQAGLWLPP